MGRYQWLLLVAQMVKHLPVVQETRAWSLGWEGPLEKEMATHSSTLAWKIPWTEEPGRLQYMGSQRVGHDWATSQAQYTLRVHTQLLSHVRLFATPQTKAHQIPLSMELSRQEYWSGLPFPISRDPPNPGIKPMSPALTGRFFTTVQLEKLYYIYLFIIYSVCSLCYR